MLTLPQSVSPSPTSSTHPRDDEASPTDLSQAISPVQASPVDLPHAVLPVHTPPVEPSRAISQSPGAIPVTPHSGACPGDILNPTESSHSRSIFQKWPWRRNDKDSASRKPDRPSAKPHDPRPRPQLPWGKNATNEGPSTMAAGQRVRVSALS